MASNLSVLAPSSLQPASFFLLAFPFPLLPFAVSFIPAYSVAMFLFRQFYGPSSSHIGRHQRGRYD